MAETNYDYPVTDTLYDTCAEGKLAADITIHPWITETLISVTMPDVNTIRIKFAAALDALEKSRVDGMVVGHEGIDVKIMRMSSRCARGVELALPVNWLVIDGFAIDPLELTGTVGRLVARLSGEWKCGGTGAELQVSESTDAGDEDKFAVPIPIPDTSNIWKTFAVDSDVVLRTGVPPNVYRLLGRRAGAGATSIRYCELALIWV